MKQKLIVIVGPTSSGKSELAVRLALRFNGEIISADSRQIYRGLDIGTGKVPGKWTKTYEVSLRKFFTYKNIVHHCIDFVDPKKTYTVAEYKKCAQKAISEIAGRGKLPILVGGTGFWIDALVYDLNIPEVPPNLKLRKKLEKKSANELLKILKGLDPRRAKTIEQKNPRRLIRAIEIAETLGKVSQIKKTAPYETFWIGINPPPNVLRKKILFRIKKMVKYGLVREVKNLLRHGISKKKIREFGFEYRLAREYAGGLLSGRELKEKLLYETLHYVRRQRSWWKKNLDIYWISSPFHLNGTNISRTLARFLASRSQVSKS